jgi:hypothetical protein
MMISFAPSLELQEVPAPTVRSHLFSRLAEATRLFILKSY